MLYRQILAIISEIFAKLAEATSRFEKFVSLRLKRRRIMETGERPAKVVKSRYYPLRTKLKTKTANTVFRNKKILKRPFTRIRQK